MRIRDQYKSLKPEEISDLAEFAQVGRWGDLNQDHVNYLAVEIARDGQRAPVLVRTGPNGKPELVAGRHRKAAIIQINEDLETYGKSEPIPLLYIIQEMDDIGAAKAAFAENTGLPLTCMDLSKAVASYSNMGWDDSRIAETISAPHHKVGRSRVSQLRSLIRLPLKIQQALHDGRLPESAARALISLGIDREEMEGIANDIEAGRMKTAEIGARARAQKRSKGKKAQRTIYELRNILNELSTTKALNLLAWLDGELPDDDIIEEIMREEDEVEGGDKEEEWDGEDGAPFTDQDEDEEEMLDSDYIEVMKPSKKKAKDARNNKKR